jgi:hypothetical protein
MPGAIGSQDGSQLAASRSIGGWSPNAVSLCGASSPACLICAPIPIGRVAIGAAAELIHDLKDAGDGLTWFVTAELPRADIRNPGPR